MSDSGVGGEEGDVGCEEGGGVKICFSSDIHGNCRHLRQILATSLKHSCDVVILGGDLAPRGSGMGVEGPRLHHFLPHKADGRADWDSEEALAYMNEAYHRQGEWFEDVLVPLLASHPIPTVCFFGNSDWKGLWPRCERAARAASEAVDGVPGRVRFVAGDGDLFTLETLARRHPDAGAPPVASVDVLSCSLVPVCAHKKKDWERCDTSNLEDTTGRIPYMDPDGFASWTTGSRRRTKKNHHPASGDGEGEGDTPGPGGGGGGGDGDDTAASGASASSGAGGDGGEEEGGVVRRCLELTEEAARVDSIEAALERLVLRYQERWRQPGMGAAGATGATKRKAEDSIDALSPPASASAPAPAKKEREKDDREDEEDREDATVSPSSSAAVPPVWVIHAPPRDTVGDLCNGGDHVGSVAIRRAIERHRPRFTMHGHIHESVRLHKGQFTQVLGASQGGGEGGGGGGSLVITVGNDFREKNPHCVIVRADQPGDAARVECTPL